MHITVAQCIKAHWAIPRPLIVIPLLKRCVKEFKRASQGAMLHVDPQAGKGDKSDPC